MDYRIIPAVVYSLPEIFTIGFVPEDLSNVDVVKVPFKVNLRANMKVIPKGSSYSGFRIIKLSRLRPSDHWSLKSNRNWRNYDRIGIRI